MKIEDLHTEIARDFKIDEQNLGSESIRVSANLFVKYIRLLSETKKEVELMMNKRKLLIAKRREYYSGQASADVYKKEPFDTIIKSETIMQKYLDNDKYIVAFDAQIIESNQKLELLEACVAEIKTLGFSIKSAIDWQKFINGI